jgi:hypothetical protein
MSEQYLLLTRDELSALTGYSQPARQLLELHKLGFCRARRDRFGQVIVERSHYDAITRSQMAEAPRPKVKPPRVKAAA